MLDFIMALGGYAFSWLIIIGIPMFWHAMSKKLFPNNEALQLLGLSLGILFMLFVVVSAPEPPDGSNWVEKHTFYFRSFQGAIGAVKGVYGFWNFLVNGPTKKN